MLQNISIFNTIFNDAPQPWQLGFQDSAAPGFTGIVELHNTIFFFLVVICVGVLWALGSIIYYYNSRKSPIVHKYLNHGTSKCLHVNHFTFKPKKIMFRNYSNKSSLIENIEFTDEKNNILLENIKPIKFYYDAQNTLSDILKDNKNKSGIYKFTNKLNGKFYIGSSKNLSQRFTRYFNISYISTVKNKLTISLLIKYGLSNFTLETLEYVTVLLKREQHYLFETFL